jgi:hypothetical protein
MKKLEKHCDEYQVGDDWIYKCDYSINEIGDKINEIINFLEKNDWTPN